MNGGVICWKSSKQNTIADSTTKTEYIDMVETTKDIIWMKTFITDLRVVPSNEEPIPVYCDNNEAIT